MGVCVKGLVRNSRAADWLGPMPVPPPPDPPPVASRRARGCAGEAGGAKLAGGVAPGAGGGARAPGGRGQSVARVTGCGPAPGSLRGSLLHPRPLRPLAQSSLHVPRRGRAAAPREAAPRSLRAPARLAPRAPARPARPHARASRTDTRSFPLAPPALGGGGGGGRTARGHTR